MIDNCTTLVTLVWKNYGKGYSVAQWKKDKPTIEYKFMIDENGVIDKIFIGKNNDENLINLF